MRAAPLSILAAMLALAILAAMQGMGGGTGYAGQRVELPQPEVKVFVELYRNGELVYTDEDPLTIHWWRACMQTLLPVPGSMQPASLEDGSTITFIDLEYGGANPLPYIEAGTGIQAVTTTVTKLVTLWKREPVENIEYYYDPNTKTHRVRMSATLLADVQPITIYEIGLSISVPGSKYLLVAYEPLSTPVQLNVSDTLTIVYVFEIPERLPFTRNFYSLLMMYCLGMKQWYASKGLMLPSTIKVFDENGNAVSGIDTGADEDWYGTRDYIQDRILLKLDPVGFNISDPVLAYNIANNVGADSPTSMPEYYSVEADTTGTTYRATLRSSWDLPNGFSVKAVGIFLETDVNIGGGANNNKYDGRALARILVAYVPVEVNVPANSGLGLELNLGFSTS